MPSFQGSSSQVNPYLAGAAGAAGGAGAVLVGQQIKSAKVRGSWALGLVVAIGALTLVSSSDLNAAQAQALALQSQAQALVIDTTSSTTLGVSVNAMRNIMITGFNNSQQIAYDANLWSFGGAPPTATLAGTTLSAALYPAAVQTVTAAPSNSTALVVLFVAIIAVLAIVLWS